ncbi:MAG: helicase-related protein, partial [Verrucomicrobiota bacterium]
WWLLDHGCTPGIWGGFTLTDDLMDQAEAMAKINAEIFPKHGARMRKELIPGFPQTQIDAKLIADETGQAQTLAEELRVAFKGKSPLALMMKLRQELELLKVPYVVELARDAALTSKVVIFVNFKKTVAALRKALKPDFGEVPAIDGDNKADDREDIKQRFQANAIPILIANNQAGGVGISLHDPVDKVERTSLICPCYNSKDLKQVFGRPQRDGGGFSRQLMVYFVDTVEEQVAIRVLNNIGNIDQLNDAQLNGVL